MRLNNSHVVNINEYEYVPNNDDNELKKDTKNQPLIVAIEVGGRDFQFYTSGVFMRTRGPTLIMNVGIS
jgi:hypothetical protein